MSRRARLSLRPLLLLLLLAALVAPSAADPIDRAEFARLRAVNERLKANVEELEASLTASPALEAYEREFRAALPKTAPKPLAPDDLAKRLAAARVVMLADDHAAAASQRLTVEALEAMARGERPLTLVIEWIDRSFQNEVNRFLAREVPLQQLEKQVRFRELWGFSWGAYAKILVAAKRLKVPVLLVERLKEKRTLAERDTFITADIAAYRKSHPRARLLVVYGEYHVLGRGHLTDKLARAGVPADLVIVGDAEETYWSLLGRTLDPERVGAADLGGGILFFPSASPLERRAAYRRYLMRLIGITADELESDWVADREVKPVAAAARKFRALELAPVPAR